MTPPPPDPPLPGSWSSRDRPVPRLVVRPLRAFLDTEAAGGIVLLAATVIALVWANSPWDGAYTSLWHTGLSIRLGGWSLSQDLRHWVNDGLMALFFFVVGLEIKRELVDGELRRLKQATLPIAAAVGGMVVPALLYALINAGGAGARGWGIPMATDIAFAVGLLALLGPSVPQSLRILLLSLAIVDDIGAILVIAVFYTGDLSWGPLVMAVLGLGLVALLRSLRVWWVPLYVVLGAGVWLATFASGVHATIAGVVLGLMTPAHALEPSAFAKMRLGIVADDESPSAGDARAGALQLQESVSVAERLEHVLHPWTSYLVIPLFALANAGVAVDLDALSGLLASRVTIGVIAGLVAGKLVGVSGFAWAAVRLGIATLPRGVGWRHLCGVAAIAGIGFTVSLFVAGLAFPGSPLLDEAKVGILLASTAASLVGAAILRR
jgi:NhaA family Na+:H+ antiporter